MPCAEIIPFEPDSVNAGEGKSEMVNSIHAIPKVNILTGMEIKINNQLKSFEQKERLTLQQLLDLEMPDKQKGIAVAIGNRVVSKSQWASTWVNSQDEVIIIKATQGG